MRPILQSPNNVYDDRCTEGDGDGNVDVEINVSVNIYLLIIFIVRIVSGTFPTDIFLFLTLDAHHLARVAHLPAHQS